MFPPALYFEELPIRLEIEWGGRLRPVETRVEQWPHSNKNVLVCHFMDEPEYGEWVVMVAGGLPYFLSTPNKLLHQDAAWSVMTRKRCLVFSFKQERLEKLESIVKRAFESDNFHIARILQLSPWQDSLDMEPQRSLMVSRLDTAKYDSLRLVSRPPSSHTRTDARYSRNQMESTRIGAALRLAVGELG